MKNWFVASFFWLSICFLAQINLQLFLLHSTNKVDEALLAYPFLWVLSVILHFLLLIIERTNKNLVGFAFIGFSLIKMFASVLYLWPFVTQNGPAFKAVALLFFLPYFTLLALDSVFWSKRLWQM